MNLSQNTQTLGASAPNAGIPLTHQNHHHDFITKKHMPPPVDAHKPQHPSAASGSLIHTQLGNSNGAQAQHGMLPEGSFMLQQAVPPGAADGSSEGPHGSHKMPKKGVAERPTQGAKSADLKTAFYDPYQVKHRRRTTKDQLILLEGTFETTQKPSSDVRKNLAAALGMTAREVQIWFQNRRAKEKNMVLRAAASGTPKAPGNKPVVRLHRPAGGVPGQQKSPKKFKRATSAEAASASKPGAGMSGSCAAPASTSRRLSEIPHIGSPGVVAAHSGPAAREMHLFEGAESCTSQAITNQQQQDSASGLSETVDSVSVMKLHMALAAARVPQQEQPASPLERPQIAHQKEQQQQLPARPTKKNKRGDGDASSYMGGAHVFHSAFDGTNILPLKPHYMSQDNSTENDEQLNMIDPSYLPNFAIQGTSDTSSNIGPANRLAGSQSGGLFGANAFGSVFVPQFSPGAGRGFGEDFGGVVPAQGTLGSSPISPFDGPGSAITAGIGAVPGQQQQQIGLSMLFNGLLGGTSHQQQLPLCYSQSTIPSNSSGGGGPLGGFDAGMPSSGMQSCLSPTDLPFNNNADNAAAQFYQALLFINQQATSMCEYSGNSNATNHAAAGNAPVAGPSGVGLGNASPLASSGCSEASGPLSPVDPPVANPLGIPIGAAVMQNYSAYATNSPSDVAASCASLPQLVNHQAQIPGSAFAPFDASQQQQQQQSPGHALLPGGISPVGPIPRQFTEAAGPVALFGAGGQMVYSIESHQSVTSGSDSPSV